MPHPAELLAALPKGLRPHALIGSGWAHALIGIEPEVEFLGGLDAFASARAWLDASPASPALDRVLMGFLSYDLGRQFEALPEIAAIETHTPDLYFAGFRAVIRYDRSHTRAVIQGSDAIAVQRLGGIVEELKEPAVRNLAIPKLSFSTDETRYKENVGRVQDWIRRGDIYQANISRRARWEPVHREQLGDLFRRLVHLSGAPFSAFIDTGELQLLSNSPERFLRISGHRIETSPIKGTRPRGHTAEEDAWLKKELIHSSKDRAEHLMIVDLERNDLGRICKTGSIHVHDMMELHSFEHVHHLVSTIEGELDDPTDWHSILRAMFPGGSITGAPKVRAMQIIEAIEPTRRGVYTGAIGYLDASGNADFNIAIRTAIAHQNCLDLHLGAGIVADSVAEEELKETSDKGLDFTKLWTAQT